ncbi:protein FAM107B isoform X1 [Petaurus breviceps papuanus]|uniref:protein FAM107B isoform X1 n=2 Tax=Petaurus breviceps papuanus TaxID=3040969 RepID=UPI0036DB5C01
MHPFPCSALLTCFGNTRDNVPFDQSSPADAHSTIYVQPLAKASGHGHPGGPEEILEEKQSYCTYSEKNGSTGNHAAAQAAPVPEELPVFPEDEPDCNSVMFHTSIPRPSIVEMPKEEEEIQGEPHCLVVEHKVTTDNTVEDPELKDSTLIPKSIMAEPDYIEDDNPELIKPQKLINPVKISRNHQDLHRELMMNQKRGLAPQNKPELQKVMEKRKRDQVIKQQKEEEAQKKKSDLEIELLKRQQKLEQLELEKQKIQEEQENAPEFVKVKGNLRRTGQEMAEVQDS